MAQTRKKYQRILLMRMHSPLIGKVKHPHHVYPPLPLKYMEALLRRDGGYEVKLIDSWLPSEAGEDLVGKVKAWSPDVSILMANPVDSQAAFEFGTEIKKEDGCFLVAVGQEVGLNLESFLSATSPFDVALPGESEVEVLSLVNRLNSRGPEKVRALYRSSSNGLKPFSVNDADGLPFPTYDRSEIDSYCFSSYPLRMKKKARWGFVLSSRGCPYGCYFCSPIMRKTYGAKVRTRSAENVADEIEHLMSLGINVISFEDDDLTARREHVLSLCREIRKRKLKINWISHARIDELDPPLMKEMKEAGCILLRLGVETGSERVLKLFRKNPRGKNWEETCKAVFAEARRLGIATNALVIIGSPGETRQEVEATIRLTLALDPDLIQVHFFTLYPGSPAYDEYKDRLPRDEISKMHHYNLPLVNLSRLSQEELWELRSLFYKRFFLRPSFVLKHIYHYGIFYIQNPKVFRQLSKVTGIL
ncbi:MAG: radical SAM protein [Deltaproteobacteria bacterium]|nr:radical SAM protein [Deltaproteobacteria bacterium]